jgi:uncharacterized protein (TIGR02284 family)
MAFDERVIRTVIEVLHDGERGFAILSTELKTPSAANYFFEESQTRGQFASELELALSAVKNEVVEEGGTASGTLHRVWGELKAKLGASDHALLETAEQGEDVAKKAYEEALKLPDLPPSLKSTLHKQQTHVLATHDRVKILRDAIAA